AAEAMSDDELDARLRPAATNAAATTTRRIEPDYTALHRELRRKRLGATSSIFARAWGMM
uniref:hypothetical protein n=1 Tax=Burkholderia vietnamiensis TaxID=60552 RepID=UPI001ABBCD47